MNRGRPDAMRFASAAQFYQARSLAAARQIAEELLGETPDSVEVLGLLGTIASDEGDWQRAIAYYRKALELEPDSAQIHYNLANTFSNSGECDRAIAHYRQAIALRPHYPQAFYNLGNLYQHRGEKKVAIAYYQQAIALDPQYAKAYNNLAILLQNSGDFSGAIAQFSQLIDLCPDDAEIHYNFANALQALGKVKSAQFHYDRAIALNPRHDVAHWNRALNLLLAGDWQQGFVEYEWRWKLPGKTPRSFPQPVWDGAPLQGKTILLHAEQGLGDALQFIRYVPLVAAKGGRVVVEAHPPLIRLFQSISAIDRLVPVGDPLPEFDVYAPLMSLPRILATTLQTVPSEVPYLHPTEPVPELQPADAFKIGVVWATHSDSPTAIARSADLADVFQLLGLPHSSNIYLYSLQKGATLPDWAAKNPRFIDLAPQLNDFADTAAIVRTLDLVITVDTAVAHLAGALAKPVWILLPFAADWRWLHDRDDSPWYPTARLFRQSQPGDWRDLFDRVKVALRQLFPPEVFHPGAVDRASPPVNREAEPSISLQNSLEGAIARHQGGFLDEAATLYRQILQQHPHHLTALTNLGMLLKETGKLAEAIACYRQGIAGLREKDPFAVPLYYNFANALAEVGDRDGAIAAYREAIARKPDHAEAYNNWGLLLQKNGDLDGAIACYDRAIAADPHYAKAHNNRGFALQDSGDIDGAIACYRQALRLDPDYGEAHNNLGVALLLQGEFNPGWDEYEWRWRVKDGPQLPDFKVPLWDGSEIQGQTILLFAEQGLGDTVQFIRYAPLVAGNGARVIALVQPPLRRLLQSVEGIDRLYAYGDRLPEFDLWAPLMSLPRLFKTDLKTIPAKIPYLKPQTRFSHPKLPQTNTLNVGLVWAGNPNHPSDRYRSLSFEAFSRLLHVPGITYFSLQKGSDELGDRWANFENIIDLAPDLHDFDTTAAAIAHLDLVITIDTAVAHVAGSLGKPVWLLLGLSPDWRWLRLGETTPWYPTMRIFRQKRLNEWDDVLDRAIDELGAFAARPQDVSAISPTPTAPASDVERAIADARQACQNRDYDRAETLCQQVLEGNSDNPQAWQLLGTIAHYRGEIDGAIANYERAIAADRTFALPYINLGSLLRQKGQHERAIALLEKAVNLQPDLAAAHYNLGNALFDAERWSEAIAAYRGAIAAEPHHPQAYYNLGNALQHHGDSREAIAAYEQAIALQPDYGEAYNNLGNTLADEYEFDRAIAAYRAAIDRRANYLDPYINLGNVYQALNQTDAAIACYQNALQIDPNFTDAHVNLAMSLLVSGDFRRGFAEYEWRWRLDGAIDRAPQSLPLWDGSPLQGETVLLYAEQGMGDAIQFVRYASLVATHGGRAIVLVPKPLVKLCQTADGVDRAIAFGDPLPQCDFRAPLMSLPRILGTTADRIRANIPYLHPSPTGLQLPRSDAFKIGLVWAGNPQHTHDRHRSAKLADFRKLWSIPHCEIYSLQKGEREKDLESFPEPIHNLAPDLHDFTETAAAIAQLDLVVTVDTAVAHLAGALGKPVWIVLGLAPDWRWLGDRDESPWYPTARLFRQTEPGNWTETLDRVVAALRQLQQQPDLAQRVNQLIQQANTLQNAGNLEGAIAQWRQIVTLVPDRPAPYYNLGNALKKRGDGEGAIAHYRQAIAIAPDYLKAYHNLGNTLLEQNKVSEAIAVYERGISLAPDRADLHANLGFALMLAGDLRRGFAEYEWRLQQSDAEVPQLDCPRWDGSPLHGKTILLYGEMGFGDSLQYIRYLSFVEQQGGRAIVRCPQPLVRLFQTGLNSANTTQIISEDDPLPPCDCQASLMSLPHLCGTDLGTIPAEVPYLSAGGEFPDRRRPKPHCINIGIVWAGSDRYGDRRGRSCDLDLVLGQLDRPGVQLYSLQKGVEPSSDRLIDLAPNLHDFADTAAAIAHLDLIVTVDTAVAHLAGALGKPTWILIPFVPDARWFLDRADSPWYPTARLFRQPQLGDWPGACAAVGAALTTLLAQVTEQPSQSEIEMTGNLTPPVPTRPLRLGITWQLSGITGWGIYGLNLTLQLEKNPNFQPMLLMRPDRTGVDNPLHRHLLQPALERYQEVQQLLAKHPGKSLWCDFPIVHALGNNLSSLATHQPMSGKYQIGTIFFENTELTPEMVERGRQYHAIVTGSSWNTQVLQSYGLDRAVTVQQGIDPTLFHPAPKANLFGDRFVIFSGGKLEYRKGQDIVVAAFKAFRQRHPEALLVTAWHNFWPQFMAGLDRTGHVAGLPAVGKDGRVQIGAWLVANGLPEGSFIDLGAIPNYLMPPIMREADVAVFTNRCEGGTNLVAMETMACGLPVILSANTGHLDLIGEDWCYPLRSQGRVKPTERFPGVRDWGESEVEEVVETLERVWQDRETARQRGRAAAEVMRQWSWEKQVNRFLGILMRVMGC
ncbi:MAG: tetratricopeptide repeat protein [Cyanobacteria bacterium J007]|nr:MAG: tetratricopeptide repeat protein [Cyanobacteria bacterium J007]